MADSVSDFITDLVTEIESGLYDKHLRPIVRACYRRREVLGDKRVGVVEDDGAVTSTVSADPPPPDPTPTASSPLVTANPMAAAFPARAVAVRKGARNVDAFRWNGTRYYRQDIEQGVVKFPANMSPHWAKGATLRIDNITPGGQRCKVTVVNSNRRNYVGKQFEISRNVVMRLLTNPSYDPQGAITNGN